jgi:pSer/pThr/pTyr-binding forkhead associated (FHA) protein
MIVLVPIDDEGEDGAPIQFNQPYIRVGHGSHNNLILDEEDQATSYEHALITVLQGRAVVVCEPTAKPTYIDGADITLAPEEDRQLKPGDILSFGKGKANFRVERIGDTDEAGEGAEQQVRVQFRSTGRPQDAGRGDNVLPPPSDESHGRAAYPIVFRVFKGDQMVREEPFSQPIIRIGRMRSSHLLLVDKSVSRTHAVIEVTADGEVLLIDLDSSSGTAVNGARVKKAVLKSGDQLSFGDIRVMIRYGHAPAGAAASAPAKVAPARRGRGPAVPPPPVPAGAEFASSSTQVLSEGEWEALESPRLVVRGRSAGQEEYVLTKPETTMGRLSTNDIQLDDGAVSGKHALLVAEAGLYLIIDQHSTNGTYLNGERCTRETLRDGDVIQIGRYELVFVAPSPGLEQRPATEILSPEAARALFAKGAGRGGKPK